MGRLDDAPPPPFDGIQSNQGGWPNEDDSKTQPRSTPPQNQPQQFPPSHQDYEHVPQMFPPQNEIPHQFPPSQPTAPHHFPPSQPTTPHHFQQPNVGVQMGHPMGGGGMQPPSAYGPGAQLQNQLPTQGWKTGLFDCMNDPQNAIITACFPCVTFGQIAEITDSGTTTCATSGMWYSLIAVCIAMPCIMSCTYRSKMRAIFGLVESPAPDWIVHCLCEWCALCQEYRELKERGYDPSIGWMGNIAMQQQRQQGAMAHPMQQRMI